VLTLLCRDRARWREGEVRLVPATYASSSMSWSWTGLARNQGVDDLYALGLIDVRLSGPTQVVTPLASDIEEAA
jgi:hypothetical protein